MLLPEPSMRDEGKAAAELPYQKGEMHPLCGKNSIADQGDCLRERMRRRGRSMLWRTPAETLP